jgi:hypothetical protein
MGKDTQKYLLMVDQAGNPVPWGGEECDTFQFG